jgi:hypothetical protein
VEAYDANKEVVFKFDGMEQIVPSDKPAVAAEAPPTPGGTMIRLGGPDDGADPNLIALPANAVKTTEKEFNKLQEAMRKDPQAFMATMGGGAAMQPATSAGGNGPGGGDRMVRSVVVNSGGGAAVINNPLELPEKK